MKTNVCKQLLVLLILMITNQGDADIFDNKTKALNLHYSHKDDNQGLYHMTETTGGGVAWVDYNHDGWMDLILVTGSKGKIQLFKNVSGQFIEASQQLVYDNSNDISMGICSADVNQDGWVDFLLTRYGNDLLFINQAGKSFVGSPIDQEKTKYQWSSSCAFSDLDNDGDVDLYIARYVDFKMNGNQSCIQSGGKGYCNPNTYSGTVDGMYFNNGQGKFIKSNNKKRGVHTGTNDRGLGVVISDFDQDLDMDIFVANDMTGNRLYENNGKGYFTDISLISGVSLNFNGVAEAGMGVALGDIDHNQYQDLILSHFSLETNTIYQNYKNNKFYDMTQSKGLNQSSLMSLGWGITLKDINNDGFEDLLVANGHIHKFINKVDSRQFYKQPNQIFFTDKKSQRFTLVDKDKSFSNSKIKSSRGLATADWNNDGLIDLAISNADDYFDIYENSDNHSNNWIGFELKGKLINSSAIGAVIILEAGKLKQRKEVLSGGSYLSQSDFRLVFGLKDFGKTAKATIIWPDGKKSFQEFTQLNKYYKIEY